MGMEKAIYTVLLFVLGWIFMFIIGYIIGHWRCQMKYGKALDVLEELARKGKSNEIETPRTKNKN